MQMSRIIGVTALATLLAGSFVACNKKSKEESKPKKFDPGKLALYKNDAIGFSILKPANVEAKVKGNSVEFSTKGFPTVTVTLKPTTIVATGGGTSAGSSDYKRTLNVPMRELICECTDTGDFHDLVKKMCDSMKNTKDAPKNPKVAYKGPKVTGKYSNQEEFGKVVAETKKTAEACWKKFVAANPKFTKTGEITVHAVFTKDGRQKSGSVAHNFNDKRAKALVGCITPSLNKIKLVPQGKDDVTVDWTLKFALYK